MINADKMSEEPVCDSCTSASPASGRTEALASWNRNRHTEKTSSRESCQSARRWLFGTMVVGRSAGLAEVDISRADP